MWTTSSTPFPARAQSELVLLGVLLCAGEDERANRTLRSRVMRSDFSWGDRRAIWDCAYAALEPGGRATLDFVIDRLTKRHGKTFMEWVAALNACLDAARDATDAEGTLDLRPYIECVKR